jgi:16S rRNA (cytosine967-C5)-methyltransferase
MTNVRESALRALEAVTRGRALPKEAVESAAGEIAHRGIAKSEIAKRDRAFLMELVYGTLRHRDLIDHSLSRFLRKFPRGPTLLNLRLALYQMLFTRVPGHASVHEAVEIEKALRGGKPELVNAVLRSAGRNRDSLTISIGELEDLPSHPRRGWIFCGQIEKNRA